MTTASQQQFQRLVDKIAPHSTLLRVWELKGGVSAQVTALELQRPDGRTIKMIVRRHGAVDLEHNPRVAADEFRLLQLLHSVGVPAPAPYYLDESGEIFATPYIVVEYIEGAPVFEPVPGADHILQFAAQLSGIHKIDRSKLDISFLPDQAQRYATMLRERPVIVDDTFDEGRVRDTLEAAWPLPERNKPVVLHGDFWPGNILWNDGRIAGVIDWEDAAIGEPLADVANSRLEILWAFGTGAMRRFTRLYRSMNSIDLRGLAYWDLCAALRSSNIAGWGLEAGVEQTMLARRRWFVAQAFEQLANT